MSSLSALGYLILGIVIKLEVDSEHEPNVVLN